MLIDTALKAADNLVRQDDAKKDDGIVRGSSPDILAKFPTLSSSAPNAFAFKILNRASMGGQPPSLAYNATAHAVEAETKAAAKKNGSSVPSSLSANKAATLLNGTKATTTTTTTSNTMNNNAAKNGKIDNPSPAPNGKAAMGKSSEPSPRDVMTSAERCTRPDSNGKRICSGPTPNEDIESKIQTNKNHTNNSNTSTKASSSTTSVGEDADPSIITPPCVLSHVDSGSSSTSSSSLLPSTPGLVSAEDLLRRPSELQLVVHMPLLTSASEMVLDVGGKSVSLSVPIPSEQINTHNGTAQESGKPSLPLDSKYVLNHILPYAVDSNTSSAKWKRDRRTLTLRLPICPPTSEEVAEAVRRAESINASVRLKREREASSKSGSQSTTITPTPGNTAATTPAAVTPANPASPSKKTSHESESSLRNREVDPDDIDVDGYVDRYGNYEGEEDDERENGEDGQRDPSKQEALERKRQQRRLKKQRQRANKAAAKQQGTSSQPSSSSGQAEGNDADGKNDQSDDTLSNADKANDGNHDDLDLDGADYNLSSCSDADHSTSTETSSSHLTTTDTTATSPRTSQTTGTSPKPILKRYSKYGPDPNAATLASPETDTESAKDQEHHHHQQQQHQSQQSRRKRKGGKKANGAEEKSASTNPDTNSTHGKGGMNGVREVAQPPKRRLSVTFASVNEAVDINGERTILKMSDNVSAIRQRPKFKATQEPALSIYELIEKQVQEARDARAKIGEGEGGANGTPGKRKSKRGKRARAGTEGSSPAIGALSGDVDGISSFSLGSDDSSSESSSASYSSSSSSEDNGATNRSAPKSNPSNNATLTASHATAKPPNDTNGIIIPTQANVDSTEMELRLPNVSKASGGNPPISGSGRAMIEEVDVPAPDTSAPSVAATVPTSTSSTSGNAGDKVDESASTSPSSAPAPSPGGLFGMLNPIASFSRALFGGSAATNSVVANPAATTTQPNYQYLGPSPLTQSVFYELD